MEPTQDKPIIRPRSQLAVHAGDGRNRNTGAVVSPLVGKTVAVTDHARAGAVHTVLADSSCLMHQQGCKERIGVPIKFIHIARA
jgi:hypothetical protein